MGEGGGMAGDEMDWSALILAAAFILVVLRSVPAIRQQWRIDRRGTILSFLLVPIYIAYSLVGVWLLFRIAPAQPVSETVALGAVAFLIGWVTIGTSWLIKLAPKYTQVAPFLLRTIGPVDFVGIGLVAAGLWAILTG